MRLSDEYLPVYYELIARRGGTLPEPPKSAASVCSVAHLSLWLDLCIPCVPVFHDTERYYVNSWATGMAPFSY